MGNVYVLSSWLGSCLHGYQLCGWDRSAIIEASGVDATCLTNTYCNSDDVLAIFAAAELLYGDAIGLEARRGIVPNTFQALSLAILSADTLRDGLKLMEKYSAYISNAYDCVLREDSDDPVFGFTFTDSIELPQTVMDAILATTVRTCRFLQPQHVTISQVDIAYTKPKNADVYASYFKAPIHWGAKEFALHITPECLYSPSMHGNPTLLKQHEHQCSEALSALDYSSFLMDVKRYIRSNLRQDDVTIENAALALNISVRSLQRLLHQERTTFKQLLDQLRQHQAKQYIENTPQSITQIAHSLGFSDAGNFTRAFKRWFSCSPNQYRQSYVKQNFGMSK